MLSSAIQFRESISDFKALKQAQTGKGRPSDGRNRAFKKKAKNPEPKTKKFVSFNFQDILDCKKRLNRGYLLKMSGEDSLEAINIVSFER